MPFGHFLSFSISSSSLSHILRSRSYSIFAGEITSNIEFSSTVRTNDHHLLCYSMDNEKSAVYFSLSHCLSKFLLILTNLRYEKKTSFISKSFIESFVLEMKEKKKKKTNK